MIGVSPHQQYLSRTKAAQLLGINRRRMDTLLRTGKLRPVKLPSDAEGGLVKRIHVSELVRYARENGITINRDSILPALGCLRLILVVSGRADFTTTMSKAGREIAQVSDLFAAGLVLGRRWYDVVVFDADSLDEQGVRLAARMVRDLSMGIKVYYVSASSDKQDSARSVESRYQWGVRAASMVHKIDDETEVI